MPEGDTLYRAARVLGERLDGKTVRAFRSTLGARVDAGRVGKRIERVEARGKNLLIAFEDGWTLHTHLRMNGSWRLFGARERWTRPAFQARVVIDVGDFVAVCFLAPVVRMLRGDGSRELDLGPDLLADEFDEPRALALLRSAGPTDIGEALMIQRLVSGIGNVYKSEILFLEGIDPFRPIASFDDDTLRRVLQRARSLMQKNVAPGARMRATRVRPDAPAGSSRFFVYHRSGLPCFRCGTRIRMRRQGQSRSTYFCPSCQQVSDAAVRAGPELRERPDRERPDRH